MQSLLTQTRQIQNEKFIFLWSASLIWSRFYISCTSWCNPPYLSGLGTSTRTILPCAVLCKKQAPRIWRLTKREIKYFDVWFCHCATCSTLKSIYSSVYASCCRAVLSCSDLRVQGSDVEQHTSLLEGQRTLTRWNASQRVIPEWQTKREPPMSKAPPEFKLLEQKFLLSLSFFFLQSWNETLPSMLCFIIITFKLN